MTIAQMARRVGYVFQNPGAMLFAPTLREELAFGPKNLGLPADVVEKCFARGAGGGAGRPAG